MCEFLSWVEKEGGFMMRRRSDIFFITMLFCLALVAFFAWMLKDNMDKEMAKQIQAKKAISLTLTPYPSPKMQYSPKLAHKIAKNPPVSIAGMGGDDGRLINEDRN